MDTETEKKSKPWEKGLQVAQHVNSQPTKLQTCRVCDKLYSAKAVTGPWCTYQCRDSELFQEDDEKYAANKQTYKKRLDGRTLYLLEKSLDYLERRMPKAPFNQLIYSYGVLHDKIYPPNQGVTVNMPLVIRGHNDGSVSALVGVKAGKQILSIDMESDDKVK